MSPWVRLLVVFAVTSLIEPVGMAQIIALLPLYLAEVGVATADVPRWVGLFAPLMFLVGLPFVPLWGVWADKYSRKAVIVRSSAVEAIVLAGVALSGTPWQLAASLALVGLSLGNTGVMLTMLRDTAPVHRLGLVAASITAAGSIGFASGPAVAAVIVDGFGRPLRDVFAVSSALMVAVVVLLVIGVSEVRPARVPRGSSLTLAYSAIRGTALDATSRGLFLLFGGAFMAGQMTAAYLPLLVERVTGPGPGLVSAIGLVVGGPSLVGGIATPIAGAIGDRLGLRWTMTAGLAGGALALFAMSRAPSVAVLAVAATVYALMNGTTRSMIMALLSRDVPEERRSTTLNLVYLPLYLAGIVGPPVGAALVAGGVARVYEGAAAVLGVCGAFAGRAARTSAPRPRGQEAPLSPEPRVAGAP